MPAKRVLFAAHTCYLDDSNGATVSSRSMMESLGRQGFTVEAFTGTTFERADSADAVAWLRRHGYAFEALGGDAWTLDARGMRVETPTHFRLDVRGVSVTLYPSPPGGLGDADEEVQDGFLKLFAGVMDRFRPDVLVNYGGDLLSHEARSMARRRGAAAVFALHNFSYKSAEAFANTDAIIVPSRFAAESYRRTLGLDCTVLPNLVDADRTLASSRNPKYVTYVNPSYEKGVFVFARIADELGRLRPDIPLLVVEGRGTERTLADCGLDLKAHGNVNLMSNTSDPRHFWGVTRICLMPSLWWENQPLVAVEAMLNGIPVIGSDRGGIPEALGNSGITLPLPDWLTPSTRLLPTAEEMSPWVEAIIRLWDNENLRAEHGRRCLGEAGRWASDLLEPQYARFFEEIRPSPSPPILPFPRLGAEERDNPWAHVAVWWDQIPGMFDFHALYDSAVQAAQDGAIFVEVGCLVGRSTCYLASKIRESGKAISLYAIDIGLGSPTDDTGQSIAPSVGGSIAGILHRNIVGCGLDAIAVPIITSSVQAARLFPAQGIDFCFIDADHSYESVLTDLRTWWPKVKMGGTIAGHDYRQSAPWLVDVTRAVHEFFGVDDASCPLASSCWSVVKVGSDPTNGSRTAQSTGGSHELPARV